MPWLGIVVLLAWPAVEIATFIVVAQWIGLLGAIAGVVASGVLGFALLQAQGLETARRARDQLDHGQLPVGALFDSACLSVAALLLILPGFVTDILALILLAPPFRGLLRRLLALWLPHLPGGRWPGGRWPGAGGPRGGAGRGGARTIEGEWVVVDSPEKPGDAPPAEPPRRLDRPPEDH